MEKPLKGDVVVVPFPFSDLTRSKRRPALVMAALPGEDLILCQMTSRDKNDPDAIEIDATDFVSGGLERRGFARPARLFTASASIALFVAGTLRADAMRKVTAKAVDILSR